jgi:hypothetical protein
MPVIPFGGVVDKKRIIRKREDKGGGEAQGVADQKKGWGVVIGVAKSPCLMLIFDHVHLNCCQTQQRNFIPLLSSWFLSIA